MLTPAPNPGQLFFSGVCSSATCDHCCTCHRPAFGRLVGPASGRPAFDRPVAGLRAASGRPTASLQPACGRPKMIRQPRASLLFIFPGLRLKARPIIYFSRVLAGIPASYFFFRENKLFAPFPSASYFYFRLEEKITGRGKINNSGRGALCPTESIFPKSQKGENSRPRCSRTHVRSTFE